MFFPVRLKPPCPGNRWSSLAFNASSTSCCIVGVSTLVKPSPSGISMGARDGPGRGGMSPISSLK